MTFTPAGRWRTILVAASLAIACLVTLATAAPKHYVCPPCGSPCDTAVYDHPGVCPKCGMTLVEQSAAATAPVSSRRRVAILVFDGVEIIDSMGPYEVFGAADFDVYTVAATAKPVTSAMHQSLVPRYSFADAPAPDVLVVPGGGVYGAQHDAPTLAWVRETAAHTPVTMSVCNGAFILASAGLLDGLTATTTAHNIPRLRAAFPRVRVVSDQRYVDNGRIITTGGLSAGIDGALHVVERILGKGEAEQVALGEEYDWTSSARYARASLADLLIPDVPLDSLGGHWRVLRTEGDARHWEMVVEGPSKTDAATLLDFLNHEFIAKGRWVAAPAGGTPSRRDWTFQDDAGAPWTATVTIEPSAGALTAKLAIAAQASSAR